MRARLLWRVVLIALSLVIITIVVTAAVSEVKPPLSVQWIYSMGLDTRKANPPLVRTDRVYVSHGGTLRCLDAVTGAELWEFKPKAGHVATAPVAFENLIMVGADDSVMYAVNASDGTQVWDQVCAGVITGDPIIMNDLLMFGAQEMVYAVAPANGQLKWICSLTAPVNEGPVSDGSMLYFLCQDGSLQSVDAAEGRYRWATLLRTGPTAFPPVVADRRVIVGGGKTLVAVSRSGAVSWSAEMPLAIGGRPTVVGDQLYVPTVAGEPTGGEARVVERISPTAVVSGVGQVLVLYPRSGRQQRSAPYAMSGTATSPPLLDAGSLYEGTANAVIYALNQETGAVTWVYRCIASDQPLDEASNYGIYAPFVAGPESLYCLSGSGDLYSLSASAPDSAGPVFSSMKPTSSDALSNRPLDVTFAITDGGSGVDPSSIQVTYDGTSVQAEFEAASGEARFHVRSPRDGVHIIKATAKDYRGNVGKDEWSFLTDASIKPPPSERAAQGRRGTTGGTTRRGGGAAGGGTRGGGTRGGGGGMRGGGGGMRGGGRGGRGGGF